MKFGIEINAPRNNFNDPVGSIVQMVPSAAVGLGEQCEEGDDAIGRQQIKILEYSQGFIQNKVIICKLYILLFIFIINYLF